MAVTLLGEPIAPAYQYDQYFTLFPVWMPDLGYIDAWPVRAGEPIQVVVERLNGSVSLNIMFNYDATVLKTSENGTFTIDFQGVLQSIVVWWRGGPVLYTPTIILPDAGVSEFWTGFKGCVEQAQ